MKLLSYKIRYIFIFLCCTLLFLGRAKTQECNTPINVALNKATSQSSTYRGGVASRAVDGNLKANDGGYDGDLQHTETQGVGKQWWQVDLGEDYQIKQIKIYNRGGCCQSRLQDFVVFVSENPISPTQSLAELEADNRLYKVNYGTGIQDVYTFDLDQLGRFVRVHLRKDKSLHMSEVEVYACNGGEEPDPGPDPLTAPQNLQVSNLTQTTATLSWDATIGAEEYILYRGATNTFITRLSETSIDLTDLTPNSDYTFRVAAVRESEISPRSSAIDFKTLPEDSPPPPPNDCSSPMNVALNKAASQSSTYRGGVASRAVDGDLKADDGGYDGDLQHTEAQGSGKQWWQVDLGEAYQIKQIKLYNRDGCCTNRLQDFVLFVSENPISSTQTLAELEADNNLFRINYGTGVKDIFTFDLDQPGRYVRVQLRKDKSLHMSEVEVYACSEGTNPDPNPDPDPEPNPLTAPQNLQASNITQTTATLNWDAVSEAEAYLVYQGANNTFIKQVSGTTTGLTGLTPNTTYSFRVSAVRGSEISPRSSLVTVTTLEEDSPPPPSDCNTPTNVALNTTASQSSTYRGGVASRAVDGNLKADDGGYDGDLQHTQAVGLEKQWWQVDLGEGYQIKQIKIYNRDGCCTSRLQDFVVFVAENPISGTKSLSELETDGSIFQINYGRGVQAVYTFDLDQPGRYVRIQLRKNHSLHMSEVEVYGCSEINRAPDPTPTPLPAPQNLQASNVGSSFFTLSWDAVSSASTYRIYQNGAQTFLKQLSQTQTSITGLAPESSYTYTVTAVDASGKESARSTVLEVKTIRVQDPPDPPSSAACGKTLQEIVNIDRGAVAEVGTIRLESDKRYILTTTYKEENGTSNAEEDQWHTISYFDGVGRPIQSIDAQASFTGLDMVAHMTYDSYGRQDKSYLPYADANPPLPGRYKSDWKNEQKKFYENLSSVSGDKTNPLAVSQFEASPLNRVVEQGAPGSAWQPKSSKGSQSSGEHTVITEYRTTSSNLMGFNPEDLNKTGTITKVGTYYRAGTLNVTRITDENGAIMETGTDNQGRIIYKSVQVLGNALSTPWTSDFYATTYYVYDAFGNVRFIIQPEGWKALRSSNLTPTIRELYCFQYEYDERQRLIRKRIPGSDWIEYAYDRLDRVVATQDGNLRVKEQWLVTKYDKLGRTVMTGIHSSDRKRTEIQAEINGNSGLYETFFGNGYTNTLDPIIDQDKYHSVTFYDTYSFLSTTPGYSFQPTSTIGFLSNPTGKPVNYTQANSSQGRVTGVRIYILDKKGNMPDYLQTVTYYDKYGRGIQIIADNHLGGKELVGNRYSFSGELLESVQFHDWKGAGEHRIHKAFLYDHRSRLLEVMQQINQEDAIILARQEYDELGQLVEKDLGSCSVNQELQSIDYTYNIRGWLTRINQTGNVSAIDGDLFGMELAYNSGSGALYNGNIANISWQQAVGRDGQDKLRTYQYSYDKMNRLKNADFSGPSGENYDVSDLNYDLNGNILRLKRMGPVGSTFGELDFLKYFYKGNQIDYIDEDGKKEFQQDIDQFTTLKDKGKYGYDASGNIKLDPHKGITYTYNHLNKPTRVDFGNGKSIDWVYAADGTKLQQAYVGDSSATHDYVGAFFYKKKASGSRELLHIAHQEGRALKLNENFRYEFNIKDHLENVRVSFADKDNDGQIEINSEEVLQGDHYYPFGMRIGGLSYQVGIENRYRYNGKEFHQELNWGMYDYGARMYDPTLGRFTGIDPLAEDFSWVSPFNYAENEPVGHIDLWGLQKAKPPYMDEIPVLSDEQNEVVSTVEDISAVLVRAWENVLKEIPPFSIEFNVTIGIQAGREFGIKDGNSKGSPSVKAKVNAARVSLFKSKTEFTEEKVLENTIEMPTLTVNKDGTTESVPLILESGFEISGKAYGNSVGAGWGQKLSLSTDYVGDIEARRVEHTRKTTVKRGRGFATVTEDVLNETTKVNGGAQYRFGSAAILGIDLKIKILDRK